MAIGWSIIAPGDRSRSEALAVAGMRSAVVMLGAMLCLVVAGFTEAFVTPSGLPTAARISIGMFWFVGLLAWTLVGGSRAVAAGASGTFRDLGQLTDAEGVAGFDGLDRLWRLSGTSG